MLLCGSAAAVTVTEGENDLVVEVLLLVAVLGTLYLCGCEHCIIGCVVLLLTERLCVLCGKEVGEDTC